MKISEAYSAIKELIYSNRLVPGQKIIYRDLEEKLGMSKTPIINGLIRLEEEGLVVSKKNRGFYIKEENPEQARQIFDLREKLEGVALDFAIEKVSDDELAVLEEKMRAYDVYQPPIYDRKKLDLDTEFHIQIAEMGGNQYFAELIGRFYENVFFKLNLIYFTSYMREFSKEHHQLFKAIEAKELDAARAIIRRHFQTAKKLVFEKVAPF